MNLMGRRGRFILKAPFNTLTPQGAQGKVIESVTISHLVTNGFDVLTRVYARVSAEGLYETHLSADVTLITIQLDTGNKITVPDTHIENLNDISLHYLTGYLTVRVGQLPGDYDYNVIKQVIASEVAKITGVQVEPRDINVSISERDGIFYTPAQAEVEEIRRREAIKGNSTDYAKYLEQVRINEELREQVLSLEQTIVDLSTSG